MILSFNLGGVHQLQKLYQFLYYKRLTCIQITTATTSEKQVYEPFADDQLSDVQNSRQSEHTKKFFVVEVCLLPSANISTVHFEQMFVKTLILHVISNNLAFQQVSSLGLP